MSLRFWFVSASAIAVIASFCDISFAKDGGKTQSNAKSSKAAEVRLEAKVEAAPPAGSTLAPEFSAEYRVHNSDNQLKLSVENIALGTVVDFYIENLKVGSATVVQDGLGTEASVEFKNGKWPTGLPTTLTAGMMARALNGATVLFEAPFKAK